MASGGSNLSISDSSFEEHRGRYCAICYHRYSRDGSAVPRILTCGHSFCTGCLVRLIGNVLRGYIRCPTCKRDTMVPGLTNEVTKLAKNFGVLDLLESIDEEKASAESIAVTDPIPLCNEHENEPKKVYCLTDSEIICIYCQVYGVHNGHDCQLISNLAQEHRQVLRTLCENLLSKKEGIVGAKTLVNDTASAVCFKEEKIMREITHHFEMLRRKLHRREAQVKALLKNRTSAKVMLLDKQKRQMTDLIARCDEQYDICQHVISGPDHEIVQQKNKLENDIQALVIQVEKHDTSPCTRDDLVCQLDTDITDRITNHGVLIKDSRKGVSLPELDHEGSSSTPSGEGSPSPGSDTTGDSEEQDIEWQELEAMPTPRNNVRSSPRRRLEASDVLIFDNDDMELEQANNNVPESAGIHGSNAGAAAAAAGGGGDMKCGGCGSPHPGSPHPEQNRPSRLSKRTLHPTSSSPGRQTNVTMRRGNYGETTTSEESPDLSDLSDMEMDLNIRSAWSNRSGWSAGATQDGLEGAVGGTRNTSTPGISAREVIDAMENSNRRLKEENLGASNLRTSGGGQGRRGNNPDPWEIAPTRRNRSHPRPEADMKCSVFNCSTGSTSFYVKCKNCSRMFCQRCTSSSISARRCYKRPRGHSFVFMPCNGGNSSANNNQVHHRHQHHHGHRQSHIRVNGSGDSSQQTVLLPSGEQGWWCTNCATINKYFQRSRTCIHCGRQSRMRSDIRKQTVGSASSRPQGSGSAATESSPESTLVSEDHGSAAAAAAAEGTGQCENQQNEKQSQDDNRPQDGAGEPQPQDGAGQPRPAPEPGARRRVPQQPPAAPVSSGISSSTVSSNDSGYENVCPSCATVNVEDAMHCSSCSTQLFL